MSINIYDIIIGLSVLVIIAFAIVLLTKKKPCCKMNCDGCMGCEFSKYANNCNE